MSATRHLLEPALDHARRGWKIFPLHNDTKGQRPNGRSGHLLSDGFKGASCDPRQIETWWSQWPDANIGLSLAASGLVAIDADLYKEDCRWNEFIRSRSLPDTFQQQSPRGGRHFVFKALASDEFAGRLCLGVDIKFNGYIILAPSTFDGTPYRVVDPRLPATRPAWLTKANKIVNRSERFAPVTSACAGQREVEELLAWIDPDAGGYDVWVEVLQGLHSHFSGSATGLDVADTWSRRGCKYRPEDVSKKWSGFESGGGITLRSIAHRARLNGADLGAIARRNGTDDHRLGSSMASPMPIIGIPKKLDLSQDELALNLGRSGFDQDAKFVASQELWYFWTGNHWQQDNRLEYLTRIRTFLRKTAKEVATADGSPGSAGTQRRIDQLKSNASVAAVASLARANPASVADADSFDRDHILLGTPAGAVDLRTGALRPGRREDLISRLTTCGPARAGASPERWLRFLDEIMAGDKDVIAFLQRACGYALTGSTREHKLLFLHGSGRNGKSVFLNTLLNLWGDYGRRVAASTFLSATTERHPTDIAGLRGARLAIASELPRGKTWDEAIIKDLTGGDRMTARFMRQNFFEFDPQLTLMIAGNVQPSFRGIDAAIRSRVVLVPFSVTIPPERQDRSLEDTLRSEGPEILRWCIEGALEWQRCGLDVPKILLKASQKYFDDEDIVGQFLSDQVVEDPWAFTSGPDLALRFNCWAESQGLSRWSQRSIVKELKGRGYTEGRSSCARGLRGLRFK